MNKISLTLFFLTSILAFCACSNNDNKSDLSPKKHLMVRKMIELEDGKLSYFVRPRDGPTLILIPGSFSDAHQWNEVVPRLTENLNLILIEVRGHGQSWPPPVNGSIEQLASDVMSVADKEKLGCFYVGGHSIGGMIAKEVGRRWPQWIAGVISIEGWTHWRALRDAFNGDMYSTLTPEQEKKRLQGQQLVVGHWTDEQRHNFGQIWRKWDKGEEFLQTTTLPVLELYGDRGRKRPSLEQLHIPEKTNVRVRWVENASHSLPLECPREVATAIMDFIEQTESSEEEIK